jgi:hypothetical protein
VLKNLRRSWTSVGKPEVNQVGPISNDTSACVNRSQKLVGTQQFALVGILLNLVDRVDETFLIVGRKLVVRHVVEQAFEIVGGSDLALDNAFVGQLRPHVFQDANQGLKPLA